MFEKKCLYYFRQQTFFYAGKWTKICIHVATIVVSIIAQKRKEVIRKLATHLALFLIFAGSVHVVAHLYHVQVYLSSLLEINIYIKIIFSCTHKYVYINATQINSIMYIIIHNVYIHVNAYS